MSLLLVNTARGAQTLDVLPLHKERRTLEEAVAANGALSAPVESPAERTAFFDAFARQPFQQVRNRFLSSLAYQNRGVGRLVEKIKNKELTLPWKKH